MRDDSDFSSSSDEEDTESSSSERPNPSLPPPFKTKNMLPKRSAFGAMAKVQKDSIFFWRDGETIFEKQQIVSMHFLKAFSDNYVFLAIVGKGSYGRVYRAKNKATGQIVACKVVKREDEYLKELNHLIMIENAYGTLPVKSVCFTGKDTSVKRKRDTSTTTNELMDNCMLMEFELGQMNLHEAIKSRKPQCPAEYLDECLEWLEEILMSVVDLHKHRILHRDLKPENIVMMENPQRPGRYTPKLIDYGLSKRVVNDCAMNDSIWYDVYTVYYRPPELFHKKGEYRQYSIKGESWAIGCILVEMLLQRVLFRGEGNVSGPLPPREKMPDSQQMINAFVVGKLGQNPFGDRLSKGMKEPLSLKDFNWNICEKIEEHFLGILRARDPRVPLYDNGPKEPELRTQGSDSDLSRFFFGGGNPVKQRSPPKNAVKNKGRGYLVQQHLIGEDIKRQLFLVNFKFVRMLVQGLLHPLPEKRWFPLDCLRILQYLKSSKQTLVSNHFSRNILQHPAPRYPLSNLQRDPFNVPSHNHLDKQPFLHHAIPLSRSTDFLTQHHENEINQRLQNVLHGNDSPDENVVNRIIDTKLSHPTILDAEMVKTMVTNQTNLIHYRLFYDYPFHRIYPHTREIVANKTVMLNVLSFVFSLAKERRPEPRAFFRGVYLWISFLFDESLSWRVDFANYHRLSQNTLDPETRLNEESIVVKILIELLFGCLDLIDDYSTSENGFLAHMVDEKSGSVFSSFYDKKRLDFAKDYVLCIKKGRVWIHNPGELRHLFFDHIESVQLWDSELDNQICDLIFATMDAQFILPHPDLIVKHLLGLQ